MKKKNVEDVEKQLRMITKWIEQSEKRRQEVEDKKEKKVLQMKIKEEDETGVRQRRRTVQAEEQRLTEAQAGSAADQTRRADPGEGPWEDSGEEGEALKQLFNTPSTSQSTAQPTLYPPLPPPPVYSPIAGHTRAATAKAESRQTPPPTDRRRWREA